MSRNTETLFAAFVERTKATIPEIAKDIHRNVSNLNLLRVAAMTALEGYPRTLLPQLFIAVIDQAPRKVEIELAALLVSFYEINDGDQLGYRKERDHRTRGPWYRFELNLDPPEWMCGSYPPPPSPHGYVSAIVAEVVAQHLVEAGGWERPARLTPSRRGQSRSKAPLPETSQSVKEPEYT